jgi:hypothetical protein
VLHKGKEEDFIVFVDCPKDLETWTAEIDSHCSGRRRVQDHDFSQVCEYYPILVTRGTTESLGHWLMETLLLQTWCPWRQMARRSQPFPSQASRERVRDLK